MLAFVHDGPLSNRSGETWLAHVLRAMARGGERVHAITFEGTPEDFDFASEAYRYEGDGSVATQMFRDTPHGGRVVLHGAQGSGDAGEALFEVLAAVAPGHALTTLIATGGEASVRAAHRARAAFGIPYVIVATDGRLPTDDETLCAHAASVIAPGELPPGVDAMALHPLHPEGREERMGELCARLGAHREQAFATLRKRLDAVDWAKDAVIVTATEPGLLTERFETVLTYIEREKGALPGGGSVRVLPLSALPSGLYPVWLPCADVFVDLRSGMHYGRPGVVEALAAGVVPVAIPASGGDLVVEALGELCELPTTSALALGPAKSVGVEALAASVLCALRHGSRLRARLRRAAVTRYDWAVVASAVAERIAGGTLVGAGD